MRVLGAVFHDPDAALVIEGQVVAAAEAALAAGARPVLVPTPQTLEPGIADAPVVARDLAQAVDLVLSGVLWGDAV